MAPVITRPAAEVDFDLLVSAFNDGYSGYAVPVNVDAPQLHHHIDQNDINLTASCVAQSAGAVVGICLLGMRRDRGWIGGLGVAPDYRRQGIGRMLMETAITTARQQGLKIMQLEVIDSNTAAHALYLNLGFADIRDLLILERAAASPPASRTGLNIEAVAAGEVLPHSGDFHAAPNPWQRDTQSLEKYAHASSAWRVTDGDETLAYAFGRATDNAIQLLDIGYTQGCEDALHDILTHIHRQRPTATGRFVNLGDDDPAWPVLQALGYQVTMRQHEMSLAL